MEPNGQDLVTVKANTLGLISKHQAKGESSLLANNIKLEAEITTMSPIQLEKTAADFLS